MQFIETGIKGLFVVEPRVFEDNRGYFFESYKASAFADHGLNLDFIQDNQARSTRGVLRGLHFQRPPYEQTKLVRVIEGEILDVAVDVRKGSETYGKHFAIRLSAENKKQLLVPKGFAHGYAVLSETAEVTYKVDNVWNPESEGGILYNDPALAINWELSEKEVILSEKDVILPTLENMEY